MDLFFNSDDRKVAVVTGSNKGIGLAVVKGLCRKFSGDVYLTARNVDNGLGAVKNLYKLGFHPKFHHLDVTNYESILKLKRHLEESYGGLDILINNAAVAYPHLSDIPISIQVKETLAVNYFGLRDVCNVLFPILRPHARVVNLSSSQAAIKNIPGECIKEKLSSNDLTETELSKLMEAFVGAAQRGTHKEEGWPDDSYAVSKIAVNALTGIQQREFLLDESREDIVVNAVHPGQIATDLTRFRGYQNAIQGAEIPLYAALLPKNVVQPVGSFIWWNKQVIDWVNGPIPLM